MFEFFSFPYIFKAARVFLSYPRAILKLARGSENAAVYIYEQRKLRYSRNPVSFRRVNGYVVYIDPADNWVISPSIGVDGWYEPEETELFKKIVRKDATVVDVGANVGWYTLLAAHLVGEKGRVLSFEPESRTFSLMKRSIAESDFGNIQAFDKGVSNVEGRRRLWLTTGNLGAHSIVRKANGAVVDVDVVTLDRFLPSLGVDRVDVLKVDVEGAEPEVLEGAREYLENSRVRNLLLEWNAEAWTDRKQLLEILLKRYVPYRIVRSPFLVKQASKNYLAETPNANLYLKLAE
ncbi:MAG: FkbM family methyltransferase [Candidatus Bathyarchaeia archaeon]